jgi:uncharacterized protein (DUF2461 family)
MHQPAPDQLDRLRRAVDAGGTAAALTRALRRAQAAGFELNAPALARAPRGYPSDHPRLDLLRRRSLTMHRRHPVGPWLHRPGAGKRVREELEATSALVRWLREHVGPSQRGATRGG